MKKIKFEDIKDVLTDEEMGDLTGGWPKLFGWRKKYDKQTMASVNGTAATGEYGSYVVFGITIFEGFRQTDTKELGDVQSY